MHAVTVLIFPLLKSEGKVSMLVQNSSGDGKVNCLKYVLWEFETMESKQSGT